MAPMSDDPRINRVLVSTGSGDVEISSETRDQLVKRLARSSRGQPVADELSSVSPSAAVELDEEGKSRLLAELTYWLDNPGAAPLPKDARALFRALEGERGAGPEPRSP